MPIWAWVSSVVLLALLAFGWRLLALQAKATKGEILEDEAEVRNKGNKARHDLRTDDDALDRLRNGKS